MPGIFGIVHPESSPELLQRSMQSMVAPLLHFPWYQWTESRRTGAAIGLVRLGTLTGSPQCAVSEDNRYVLAFEGELFNAHELQKELGVPAPRDGEASPHATIALHALRRRGAAALERFNGLFQLALWDAGRKELLVSGDRGGLRPIYLVQQGNKLAFAPEVKALLTLQWVSRAVDYAGVLGFLRHGFCLGQHTFFHAVKVLPPGAFAVFRQGRLQVQRYWKMDFQQNPSHNEKEASQRFIETWRDVMHTQTEGEHRHGLPLSGGVDSRLILAAMAADKREVLTFTIGNPGCKDAEIAKRVAETAGYANLFSPIVAGEAATSLERAVYLTDGMFNCFHANVQRLLPGLAETASVVYDGITPLDGLYGPEDLFWRQFVLPTKPLRWLHSEVDNKNIHAFTLAPRTRVNLLSPEAQAHLQPECDLIAESLKALGHDNGSATAVVDRFWLEEFKPRFAAFGPQLLRSIVDVRCPYFDNRMLDLVGTLTPLQRSSYKPLQRAAISALTPALARIPWERTGLPLTAGFYRTQGRRAANALRRRLNAALRRQPATSDSRMIDYDEMIRNSLKLQKKVATIMIERWPEGSRVFNRNSLRLLLAEHMNRSGNFAEIIGRIVTVETWHKLFVRDAARLSRIAAKAPEQIYHMAA
ncbi:hypothetical protein DCC62_02065 [candidate division KSB1 bacterium]|nr:MAG: hypothetical protein DCC62_02065 [candidate division KSB1 bacterium]